MTDVLTEVAALTPGPYLHIGGDESDATADDDYANFVQRAAAIAAATDKTVLGWHDIARAGDLPPGTVAQYWSFTRDVPTEVADQMRGFVERGGQIVMSPADVAYLDHKYDDETPRGQQWARGFTDLPEAYAWDPADVLDGVDEDTVIGVEATLFTEKLRTLEEVESMGFPRLAALAEVGWTAQDDRDLTDLQQRLAALGPRWDAAGVTYTQVPEVAWP